MDENKMKIKTIITAIIVGACFVSAETESFRPGNLLQWLISILGFNLIDSSTALPEFLTLIFLIGVIYIIIKKVWK